MQASWDSKQAECDIHMVSWKVKIMHRKIGPSSSRAIFEDMDGNWE